MSRAGGNSNRLLRLMLSCGGQLGTTRSYVCAWYCATPTKPRRSRISTPLCLTLVPYLRLTYSTSLASFRGTVQRSSKLNQMGQKPSWGFFRLGGPHPKSDAPLSSSICRQLYPLPHSAGSQTAEVAHVVIIICVSRLAAPHNGIHPPGIPRANRGAPSSQSSTTCASSETDFQTRRHETETNSVRKERKERTEGRRARRLPRAGWFVTVSPRIRGQGLRLISAALKGRILWRKILGSTD